MFPTAELPRLPGEARPSGGLLRRAPAGRRGSDVASRFGFGGLTESQSRLLVICSSAAVLLIVIVLAITGAFSGGDDDPTTTARGVDLDDRGDTTDNELTVGRSQADRRRRCVGNRDLWPRNRRSALRRPVDPRPRSGAEDQTYVVWLMLTGTKGYPLSPITVDQDGTYEDRFAIPSAVLPVIARVHFVDVSIAP